MKIEDLKHNLNIVNSIDWDMTPEEAIALHLEWGPLRDLSYYNSRDNNNETIYFVISTWKNPPMVSLIKRRGFDSEELITFRLPMDLELEFKEDMKDLKGVFAVDGKIKEWLKRKIEK
jgi:hypothetical protein